MSLASILLTASNTTTAAANKAATPGSGWSSYLFLGAVIVLMYFLLIRPQKKRQKEEQLVRESLQVGDEVITIGGICGKVINIKEDSFILETGSDKNKIRFMKWSIQENLSAPKPEKKPLFGKKKKAEEEETNK